MTNNINPLELILQVLIISPRVATPNQKHRILIFTKIILQLISLQILLWAMKTLTTIILNLSKTKTLNKLMLIIMVHFKLINSNSCLLKTSVLHLRILHRYQVLNNLLMAAKLIDLLWRRVHLLWSISIIRTLD